MTLFLQTTIHNAEETSKVKEWILSKNSREWLFNSILLFEFIIPNRETIVSWIIETIKTKNPDWNIEMKANFTALMIGLDASGKSTLLQSTKDDLV